MPRSPSTYSLPPGTTPQHPNTTIPSATFNAAMDDIANTFNTIQPVVFGGTGVATPIAGWDVFNSRGANVASSGSINLTATTGANIHLTGTTTITSVTLAEGAERLVIADGAVQLTASANLVVNGSTSNNYTTTAGDLLTFVGDAASVVRVWVDVAATSVPSAASTTEILTGTNTAKFGTPDSIAALWEAGSDNTGGATITMGEGAYFNLITSTTAITAFAFTTDKAGRSARVRFNTVRTLTHNGTTLIIPGAANVTTAQGDIAQIRSLGSGNFVVEWYQRGATPPIPAPSTSGNVLTSDGTRWNSTAPASTGGWTSLGSQTTTTGNSRSVSGLTLTGYKMLRIVLNGVSLNTSGNISLNSATVGATTGAGGAVSGLIDVNLSNGISGATTGGTSNTTATAAGFDSNLSTGSTSVTLTTNQTFDAGSFQVWGSP